MQGRSELQRLAGGGEESKLLGQPASLLPWSSAELQPPSASGWQTQLGMWLSQVDLVAAVCVDVRGWGAPGQPPLVEGEQPGHMTITNLPSITNLVPGSSWR